MPRVSGNLCFLVASLIICLGLEAVGTLMVPLVMTCWCTSGVSSSVFCPGLRGSLRPQLKAGAGGCV